MTTKLVNMLLLLLILCVGAGYLYYSYLISERRLGDDLRPIYFPVAVGAGIIVLSAIELLRAIRSRTEDDLSPFEMPNLGKLLATIALMAAHFLVWQRFGLFYPATFALFVGLVLVYRATFTMREIGIAVLWSGVFTALLYLVFQYAFGIALG